MCKECPFVEIQSRSKNGQQVKIKECRAGEKEPNHINSYAGDENSRTNLHVFSLDWNWIEGFKKECEELEHVTYAHYTQDTNDCRKALTIGFSQNKKGIEAKKYLLNKYFPKN